MPDSPPLVPPLRRDLTWEEGADGVVRLADPRAGRKLKVDERGRQIAMLLDRLQTADELAARIAATGRGIAEEALARVLAAFDGLGLLDTSETLGVADRMARVEADWKADPARVPIVVPPDLRFECRACGSCCLGANIGPVTDDVMQGLNPARRKELKRAYAGRKGLFFSMVPDGGDDEILVCQSRNGGCVFIDPDGLCGIHRRWGSEAKPHVCRLFPLQFVLTPRGVVVGLQTECRSILDASRGRPLAEQMDAIRPLLRLATRPPSARQFVSLDGVATLSYAEYEALEDEAVAAIAGASGGFGMELAAARCVAARLEAAGRAAPEPIAEADLRHEFYGFLQDLGEALARLKQEHKTEGEGVRFHTSNLDLLLDAMSDVPLFADAVCASDEDPESARFARLAMTNAWRSKDFLHPVDLATARAVSGLRWLLTRACAVTLARRVSRRRPLPQDLVDAWIAVNMLLRNKRVLRTIADRREALVRLFGDRLEALVAMGGALVDVDPRTDFYLF
ncbi:MAG: YkgJ family cysteine cluster protein [Deltaproteobacteria bacterium]|nr:YkgJ family cysteine cluster protein [Deltaproteobacteria bacterium]